MPICKHTIIYYLCMLVLLIAICVPIFVTGSLPTAFHKSSMVYFNCPAEQFKKYEVVRSSEGRITAIYDRQNKEIVSGRKYVEDTTNCIVVKVEESVLEKQDQDFFEIISFRSNNEELY